MAGYFERETIHEQAVREQEAEAYAERKATAALTECESGCGAGEMRAMAGVVLCRDCWSTWQEESGHYDLSVDVCDEDDSRGPRGER